MKNDTNTDGIPSGQTPKTGRMLFWKCPKRCGKAITWNKTVTPPVALCGCGQSSDPDEQLRTDRALAALDTMATVWASGFDIRKAVQVMMSKPDGEDRLIAFIKQAHCEGLYAGRMSHQDEPQHPDGILMGVDCG